MDMRWLQDFLTLAETGHFTRAAERRNVSQAAFSRRIQSLEAWAGAALVDRGSFPIRLTPAGEQFREHAAEVLTRLIDARTEIAGKPGQAREHVRVALPYALATARFARWWPHWTSGRRLRCSIVLGNIHDLVTSLVSGEADIMICYHCAHQPVHLDPGGFERLVVGEDRLRPYAAPGFFEQTDTRFPGREGRPVPLLSYTPGVYFARLVEVAMEQAPERVHGARVIESDMADVLRDMAAEGHGVAWLPDSSVTGAFRERLAPVAGDGFALPLSIVAYRQRGQTRRAVERLWEQLAAARSLEPAA
jgi:DNA-binding transcriptional LysR family regulator